MSSKCVSITSSNSTRAATLSALLIIFFLGMGLRLYQLDADSLWLDEIVTATKARLELPSIPQTTAQTDTFPPLVYILTHLFMRFLGGSDFVVRLPAALLGSLSIPLIYAAGSMLWNRKIGLAAAFLLAVNPWHIRYSQEARWYAPMVFLSLLSLIFLVKALRGNSRGPWIAFALVTSLALYNHYFAFLILPALVLFAAWVIWDNWNSTTRGPTNAIDENSVLPGPLGELANGGPPGPPIEALVHQPRMLPNPRTQALYLGGSLLLVALCYAPWLPMMHQQLFGSIIQLQGVGAERQNLELAMQLYRDMLSAHSGAGGAGMLFFLILFLLGLTRCKPRQLLLFGLWCATPFVFISLASTARWVHPRYAIHILPVWLLLVARGIGTIGHWVKRCGPSRMAPSVRSLAVMTPLLILASLVQAPSLRAYYIEQKQDWRGATRYLAALLQPGDAIVAEGSEFRTSRDDHIVLTSLTYYLDLYGVGDTPILRLRDGLWQELQDLDTWNGHLWGVVYHENGPGVADRAQVEVFPPVSIVRLREPSGRTLHDTQSLLAALLHVLPPGETRFDTHLALADLCIQTGQLKEAQSQLHLASVVKPEDPRAARFLDRLQLRCQQLSHTLEGMRYPRWVDFGDVIALLGYDLQQESEATGSTLEVTTWWRALGDMNEDYTVFVHLLDSDGRVLAQEDKLLQRGRRSTSAWEVEEIVMQRHKLALSADITPSEYTIDVGLYYWKTGERLPVWDEYGERVADDAILLQPESEGSK